MTVYSKYTVNIYLSHVRGKFFKAMFCIYTWRPLIIWCVEPQAMAISTTLETGLEVKTRPLGLSLSFQLHLGPHPEAGAVRYRKGSKVEQRAWQRSRNQPGRQKGEEMAERHSRAVWEFRRVGTEITSPKDFSSLQPPALIPKGRVGHSGPNTPRVDELVVKKPSPSETGPRSEKLAGR